MSFFHIVLFCLLNFSKVKCAKLEIVSIESKMNSKFYKNVSVTFKPLTDGFYSLNFSAITLVSIEGGYFVMTTTLAQDRKFQCSDTKLFENRLNLCHMNKLLKFNVITEMLFTSLLRAASVSMACPFPPQDVAITNLIVGIPPVPLPLPNGHFCVTLKLSARSKGSKKIEPYATFDLRLIVEK